jgi:hypothetical protein
VGYRKNVDAVKEVKYLYPAKNRDFVAWSFSVQPESYVTELFWVAHIIRLSNSLYTAHGTRYWNYSFSTDCLLYFERHCTQFYYAIHKRGH